MKKFDFTPIPTSFNGINYRSRLEARWAVFWKALGMNLAYEKYQFKLPTACYRPDFYYKKGDFFIEIKGKAPSPREQKLCQELAIRTRSDVYLFWGDVGIPNDEDPKQEASGLMFDYAKQVTVHNRVHYSTLYHRVYITNNLSIAPPHDLIYAAKEEAIYYQF